MKMVLLCYVFPTETEHKCLLAQPSQNEVSATLCSVQAPGCYLFLLNNRTSYFFARFDQRNNFESVPVMYKSYIFFCQRIHEMY